MQDPQCQPHSQRRHNLQWWNVQPLSLETTRTHRGAQEHREPHFLAVGSALDLAVHHWALTGLCMCIPVQGKGAGAMRGLGYMRVVCVCWVQGKGDRCDEGARVHTRMYIHTCTYASASSEKCGDTQDTQACRLLSVPDECVCWCMRAMVLRQTVVHTLWGFSCVSCHVCALCMCVYMCVCRCVRQGHHECMCIVYMCTTHRGPTV